MGKRPPFRPGATERKGGVCRGLERDVVVRGRAGARRSAGGLEVAVVDRDVGTRGEAATAVARTVLAAAQELDGVGDDLDALALVAVLRLPLAPLEAAVERDRPALGEEARAVLALGAPDRHVEEVGLVLPLPRGLVLAAGVGRDPQRAHGHAARRGAKLGISGEVAREDDPVDVRRGHEMAPFGGEGRLEARRSAESTCGTGGIRLLPRRLGCFVAEATQGPARARVGRYASGASPMGATGVAAALRSGGGGVPGRSLMIRWRRMPSVIFRLWSSCSSSSRGPRNWIRW